MAVVSIWEPHPPLHGAACCFAQAKQCCRRSIRCLASGPSASRLTRPVKRMLSRYSSLMTVLHSNINRCYQAVSGLRQDGASKHFLSVGFGRVVLGVVLVMSISAASYTTPSCKWSHWQNPSASSFLHDALMSTDTCVICHSVIQASALTEENLLFLEAWRAVDRAYYDKTFNGQSWFRYRENALRNEPMNTREETCMVLHIARPFFLTRTRILPFIHHKHNSIVTSIAALGILLWKWIITLLEFWFYMIILLNQNCISDAAIKKMLSTLDDPFTRFLEPEKLKSLRV